MLLMPFKEGELRMPNSGTNGLSKRPWQSLIYKRFIYRTSKSAGLMSFDFKLIESFLKKKELFALCKLQ